MITQEIQTLYNQLDQELYICGAFKFFFYIHFVSEFGFLGEKYMYRQLHFHQQRRIYKICFGVHKYMM